MHSTRWGEREPRDAPSCQNLGQGLFGVCPHGLWVHETRQLEPARTFRLSLHLRLRLVRRAELAPGAHVGLLGCHQHLIRRVGFQPGDQIPLTGGRQANQRLARGLLNNRQSTRPPDKFCGGFLNCDPLVGQLFEGLPCVDLDAVVAAVDRRGRGRVAAPWPDAGSGGSDAGAGLLLQGGERRVTAVRPPRGQDMLNPTNTQSECPSSARHTGRLVTQMVISRVH